MTDQTPVKDPQDPYDPRKDPHSIFYAKAHPVTGPQPGSLLYAPPLDAETLQRYAESRERTDREHREKTARMNAARKSSEFQKVRKVVEEDENVAWPDFLNHVGGILEVVQLVDETGMPDVDRIVSSIDELFDKLYAKQEFQGGVVFRRKPRNRPYQPGPSVEAMRAARAGEFPGDRESALIDRENNPFQPKPRGSVSHR